MNTEAMPLMKHDHYQQQGGANFPMEEKAPFLATTTTTKTRVTRAALVLCVVAAVAYCTLVKPQMYDHELVAAGGVVLRDSSSSTETTGRVRGDGGNDDAVGCADLRADGGYSFQLKAQKGCFGNGDDDDVVFKPGEYGCIIAESAPFGPMGGAAIGKCFIDTRNPAQHEYGCYCCRDGGSATPEGLFPMERLGNPVPNCTAWIYD